MAPLNASSDLAAVLSEQGVQVVLGPDTTFGIVRGPDALELEADGAGSLIARQIVVTVQTGSLTALATGATISVNATNYRVRDHMASAHGHLTQIHCIKDA